VLMAQTAPVLCSSRINSMHSRSRAGPSVWATSVPSKSVARSLISMDILRLNRSRPGARVSANKMKSAYELAMERLQKNQQSIVLTDDQKKQLAEIESQCKAKIAERELFLKEQITKAQVARKFDEVDALEKQLASEIRRLQEDCESKKEKMRASFATPL